MILRYLPSSYYDSESDELTIDLCLDMDVGKIDCMQQMGVTESFMVKRQVLVSAAEAAEMILRVDDIIKAAPRRREQDRSHC